MARPTPDPEGAEPAGRLRRLLEVEERLEAEIRERRGEAARLVAEAAAEAEALRGRTRERLEAEAEALERRIRESCDREAAAIRAEADLRGQRWSEADDAVIEDLAGLVLRRVAGEEPDGV